jgi:hypothetical protein
MKLAAFPYGGWVPFPVGDAEKHSGLRGSRRGLSEPSKRASSAAAEAREHRREVSVRSTETVTSGVAFFWLLFLAKQEK